MPRETKYWLVKTEPDVYSIHDLNQEPKRTTCWDGVRNYQARNFLRDEMKLGDRVFIYHSSTKPMAIVGVARIVRESYPDDTAFDPKNAHFDADSDADDPRWFMVDLQLEEIFKEPLTLEALKAVPALKQMELLRRGSRLSVQRVRPEEFEAIMKLRGK
jgi:predicted RNA-binding protein with PUA-like domain